MTAHASSLRLDIAARRAERGRRSGGFTLLEALVALVIAGLALQLLLSSTRIGLGAAEHARKMQEAVVRAQGHLAFFLNPSALVPGARDGDEGNGFHWAVDVRSVATAPPYRQLRLAGGVYALDTTLYAVTVTISWQDGRATHSVELTGQFLAPPPSAP